MADETAEEIIQRLEQEQVATADRDLRARVAETESAEDIVTRLRLQGRQEEEGGRLGIASARDPAYFNRAIASAAGLLASPVVAPFLPAAPDSGRPLSTYEWLDERVGASRDAAVGLFERLGFIPPNLPARPDTYLGQIMQELPTAMVATAGTLGAAPAVASRLAGSASPAGAALGEFASQVAARPATTARAIIGSEPGVVIGREAARPYIEGAFPGTEYPLTAAAARSALFFGAELLGGLPAERLARAIVPVPRAERILPADPFTTAGPGGTRVPDPVLNSASDPDLAGRIARVQSVNFTDTLDRFVARALDRVAPATNEATASRQLREGLLVAREYGERVVARAYRAVPDSITGNPQGFRDEVLDQLNDATRYPGVADTYPVDRLRAIQEQLMAGTDPSGRPIWRNDIPISELADIRSRLIQQGRNASETSVMGSQASRELQTNIQRLTTSLDQSIEAVGMVDPRFQPLYDRANAMYHSFNDWYRRGPVGELLMTTRHAPMAGPGQPRLPGSSLVPPTEVARRMLQPDETADAVAGALNWVRTVEPGSQLGQAIANGTARRAEDAIRLMFSDDILRYYEQSQARALRPSASQDIPTTYSQQRGPVAGALDKARTWLADNAPLLDRWTNATSRLFTTTGQVNRYLQARDAHTQSTVSQFIGRPAVQVVEQTLRMPDSTERFASLHRMFRTNDDFIEGIQRALIDSVFAGRGADPNVALARLRDGKYSTALREMFANDPKKLDRLYQMVQDAADITTVAVSSTAAGSARILPNVLVENMRLHERVAKSVWENVWRIAGLASGNVLARTIPLMGSAGSLSIPMRMGTAARDLAAASWITDRRTALSIVRDAVFNPELETWLRNNAPGNYTDLQAANNQLNRYLRRFYAATNQDIDELVGGHGSRLYWEERRQAREEMGRARRSPFKGN